MKPLVSVIIPVYKVEKYLDRCIASVLQQTYRNLEIIIIDDGSPDKCPQICDEYAANDNRIKVIHQENKGLSGARNSGLDVFSGDYVTFLDSDDYIENTLVEDCIKVCTQQDADMVLYLMDNIYKDCVKVQYIEREYYNNTETIVEGVLWDRVPSYVVRFFKRHLWENVRFPLNTNWEDLTVMPDVILNLKKAVFLDKVLYHYECGNANSTSSNIASKNKFGMYWGWRKRAEIGLQQGKMDLYKHAMFRSLRSAITALGLNTKDKLLLPEQTEELKNYLSQEHNNKEVPHLGIKYNLLIWSLFYCPLLLSAYGNIMYGLQSIKRTVKQEYA